MLGGRSIRQPELAEKFKFILIFGLLSLSIIILIIISHVELHNKIVFNYFLANFRALLTKIYFQFF